MRTSRPLRYSPSGNASATGWSADAAKRRNVSTFDDDNSQSALRLLLAVADAAMGSNEPRDVRIREARDYALTKLLGRTLREDRVAVRAHALG